MGTTLLSSFVCELNVILCPHELCQWIKTQVRGVMFCVEANCATVCLHGRSALRFFRSLDPLHTPPHRIAFMRLVRLLEQAISRELKRILSDNILLYCSNFVSTNSDFYTNKERQETFRCLVANMLAQVYVFEVCLVILILSNVIGHCRFRMDDISLWAIRH